MKRDKQETIRTAVTACINKTLLNRDAYSLRTEDRVSIKHF